MVLVQDSHPGEHGFLQSLLLPPIQSVAAGLCHTDPIEDPEEPRDEPHHAEQLHRKNNLLASCRLRGRMECEIFLSVDVVVRIFRHS